MQSYSDMIDLLQKVGRAGYVEWLAPIQHVPNINCLVS